MTDILVKGTITALSPINIKKVEASAEESGVPHMTVREGGVPKRVPVIPGATFKGLLRARAARISDRATGGAKLLDQYYVLHKGGIKGNEAEDTADILRNAAFRRSNPVLGLFGSAAPLWLGGRLGVGNAMPDGAGFVEVDTTSMTGARRDDFRINPELLDGFDESERRGYVEYAKVRRQISTLNAEVKTIGSRIGRLIGRAEKAPPSERGTLKAEKETLEARRREAEAEIAVLKGHESFKNTVGRTLPATLAIAPGSRFTQRIVAMSVLDDEAGLLLATLRSLQGDCRIGGLESTGYGHFRADWSLSWREDDFAEWRPLATLSVEPDVCEYEALDPFASTIEAAWAARVAAPDGLRLEPLPEEAR